VYVAWLLLAKRKPENKKNQKNDDYLYLNDKFVNNSIEEQTDLEAILGQMEEVENNSKLLEAFKNKGASSEDVNNSLTRLKNEKFKIIRNKDVVDKTGPDPKT
jgi:K+/H+ antiporter YhaU regulatory subunit KhtT